MSAGQWLNEGESARLWLFWMSSSRAALVISSIYVLYTLYLLGTCIWLYLCRKHYLFGKSLISMSVCSAGMQWLLVSSHIWRYLDLVKLPIPLIIWRNYVFFPLCILFSLEARGMHIIFEAIWTRSIGHPALSHASSTNELSRKSAGGFCRYVRGKLRNPKFRVWLKNRGTFILTGGLSTAHVLVAVYLHYMHVGEFWTMEYRCNPFLGMAGIFFSVGVYVVVWCPLMLYYLSEVKDAYGLRNDLKIGMSYALPFYLMYMVIRQYDFLQELRRRVPAFMFMLWALVALHSATVTSPLVRTIFWVPEELDPEMKELRRLAATPSMDVVARLTPTMSVIIHHKPIPFEIVLENEQLRAPFEAYSKNAFVWDSVLFHQAVKAFRERAASHPETIAHEAQKIYEQYIVSGSPCEMNLGYGIVVRIQRAMLPNRHHCCMFDEAQAEVVRIVGNCTYRNFLYTLDAHTKARYMVPFGRELRSCTNEHGTVITIEQVLLAGDAEPPDPQTAPS